MEMNKNFPNFPTYRGSPFIETPLMRFHSIKKLKKIALITLHMSMVSFIHSKHINIIYRVKLFTRETFSRNNFVSGIRSPLHSNVTKQPYI